MFDDKTLKKSNDEDSIDGENSDNTKSLMALIYQLLEEDYKKMSHYKQVQRIKILS